MITNPTMVITHSMVTTFHDTISPMVATHSMVITHLLVNTQTMVTTHQIITNQPKSLQNDYQPIHGHN